VSTRTHFEQMAFCLDFSILALHFWRFSDYFPIYPSMLISCLSYIYMFLILSFGTRTEVFTNDDGELMMHWRQVWVSLVALGGIGVGQLPPYVHSEE
jgi:hypothetical protein